MTEAELNRIVAEAARGHFSWIEVGALVAEVRRLHEALEEITRLGQGHLLTTAVDLARIALHPPADH